MIIHTGLIVLVTSNIVTAFVALARICAAARTQRNHDVARYKIVRAIGQGSRVVDIDGVGMVIDIGTAPNIEGRSDVDY